MALCISYSSGGSVSKLAVGNSSILARVEMFQVIVSRSDQPIGLDLHSYMVDASSDFNAHSQQG